MTLNRRERLCALGWREFFENQYQALERPEWISARVVGEEKNLYRVDAGGLLWWAELSGKYFHSSNDRSDWPSVGDWVACVPLSGTDRAVIHHRYERLSCLVRKV